MNERNNARYGLAALLALAWPVVIARSAQAVVGFCDALMVSHLGESQLAAVTTGALNFFSAAVFPMGVVFIVQSFASQLTGKGDPIGSRRYAWYALFLALVFGLLALASTGLVEPVLSVLNYKPDVTGYMGEYLEIRLLAVGAVVGIEALGNWYGGIGNTRLHMLINMFVMGANVFLNWVLIYGKLGAPAMGTRGAAWSSVIASVAGFLIMLIVFLREHGFPRALGLRRSEFWRMLRFGAPNGFNWFLEFAAFTVFINVVVADLGTSVLAAMMVVININSISFMPAFGLSSAGAILVGQAIGAGEKDTVPSIVKRTWLVTTVWQGAVGTLYVLAPALLFQLFTPPEHEATRLLEYGVAMLAVSAAWQLFDAAAMSLSEALRGTGDTQWCMWARIVLAWLVFMPGSFISIRYLGGGHLAVMWWLVAYMGGLAAALAWRFRSGAWRKIELTEESELPV